MKMKRMMLAVFVMVFVGFLACAEDVKKPSAQPKDASSIWEMGGSASMTDVQKRKWAVSLGQFVYADDLFFALFDRDMKDDIVVNYDESSVRSYPDPLAGWIMYKVKVKYITGGGYERWDEWNYKLKSRKNNWRVRIGGTVYSTYDFLAGPRSEDSQYFPELR